MRYWSPPLPDGRIQRKHLPECVEEIREELSIAVKQHMVADVPIGAFLSGGVDSTTVVGLAQRCTPYPLRTFSMVFGKEAHLYDERAYAREVAAWFGTDHSEIEVNPNLMELLPQIFEHFDQPFGNPTAILAYELSKQTRSAVTVALAGDGGDEIFMGYPRYVGMALAQFTGKLPLPVRTWTARRLSPYVRDSLEGDHSYRRIREFLESLAMPPEKQYMSWVGYFS
ncbi:MAG: asparagine synthase C-terminal domain-containing protein, partial [Sandaracinaceae bacterium]|nr:asparagine synthase C-terminal domain-containing protein [Sandaracinaceae bacterium]